MSQGDKFQVIANVLEKKSSAEADQVRQKLKLEEREMALKERAMKMEERRLELEYAERMARIGYFSSTSPTSGQIKLKALGREVDENVNPGPSQ